MSNIKNLTVGRIRNQLFSLALPVMGTSFIQMAYSFTDMAWVGRLGSRQVAAIGTVGILVWTTNSLAIIGKVGSEVNVAQCIGAGRLDKAQSYASHNIMTALALAVVWSAFVLLFSSQIIDIFSLEKTVAVMAGNYLHIVTTAFPFIFLSAAFTGIYNAAGQTKVPFCINAAGLIVNMILDPTFIFLAGMGVEGAAWATWISQAIVCLLFIGALKWKKKLFPDFSFFTKVKSIYAVSILKVGLPVAALNSFFSMIGMLMSRQASTYGGYLGVMTLTAGGQLEAIAWYTSQGFSTALSTFVAQNHSAGKYERVKKGYYLTLAITAVIGVGCTFLFYYGGEAIFSLVTPEPDAYKAGGLYLKIDSYSMIFMMVEITIQGVFYGTGRTLPPAIVSICGNVMRLPVAVVLCSSGMGIAGVWWAISASSIMKGIALYLWLWFRRRKILLGIR